MATFQQLESKNITIVSALVSIFNGRLKEHSGENSRKREICQSSFLPFKRLSSAKSLLSDKQTDGRTEKLLLKSQLPILLICQSSKPNLFSFQTSLHSLREAPFDQIGDLREDESRGEDDVSPHDVFQGEGFGLVGVVAARLFVVDVGHVIAR